MKREVLYKKEYFPVLGENGYLQFSMRQHSTWGIDICVSISEEDIYV